MKLTVTSVTDPTLVFDIQCAADMSIADVKGVIQAEVGDRAPSAISHLYHSGKLLQNQAKSLTEHGVKDGDLLMLYTMVPQQQQQQQPQQQAAPSGSRQAQGRVSTDSEMLRRQVLGDFRLMDQLREEQPELAEAINDPERFRQILETLEQQRRDAEAEREREIAALEADPFNPESQRKIEEIIRKQAVRENLQNALEHHPEAFGRVIMLYIDVEVNGTKVKAFVDSGAQTTIMSPACAERCGIMRLVDEGFAGIARGVGTAKILGRVHSAQLKIANVFLPCSFTVMEGKDVDLLLGLDMLKRHRAILNLEKNCLSIQGQDVPFLGEAEIPKHAWEKADEPTVTAPSGATIGAESGTVIAPPPPAGGAQPAAAAASAEPAVSVSGAAPASVSHSDADIQELMGLGFSREEAIAALDATDGNVEFAASLLFGQ